MKLATFIESNRERFGLVLPHPTTGELWIFDPNRVQQRIELYASRGTSPLHTSRPKFFDSPVPDSLTDFLASGQRGLDDMHRLADFLLRFLEQSDEYILRGAGFAPGDIQLRAPIPRPRLFFGLVQNSPTAFRNNANRTTLNLFPQGHQRPQGSVLGPGDPIVLPDAENTIGGWNPELGVIIGQGGRNIPVEEAMLHVAGLTIVSDVTYDYYRRDYFAQEPPYDWFEDAMSSWGDKKSDARTPMGPYLVTPDEVGNPYDLLIYTWQSGLLRDRSHTGAMLLGIERTIHGLSQFVTLFPGDVIHMGTMGYDGSPHLSEFIPEQTDYIESEIEKLGVLRNPMVIDHPEHDWRDYREPGKSIHPAPAVRNLIESKQISVLLDNWTIDRVRHVWLVFGNYENANEQEAIKHRPYPRFLCAPNTVVSTNTSLKLPQGASSVSIGCELAFVVGQLATAVSEANAPEYILGYAPMLAVYDGSLEDSIVEPASMQEMYLPRVYGRWHDGFNIIGDIEPVPYPNNAVCRLSLDGGGSAEGSTGEYIQTAPQVLAYISKHITLFPGDVITLGRLSHCLEMNRVLKSSGTVEIRGIGSLSFHIQ
ncbi:MAG: fumarylacetoacetate hydrolase family protein [Chloroflexota bacterium]